VDANVVGQRIKIDIHSTGDSCPAPGTNQSGRTPPRRKHG
jgi:hypothetical protein